MSKTFNIWLQSRLTAHGFACGPIDGDVGPVTMQALRAFEASRGLKSDGTVDRRTEALLREPSSLVPPAVKALIPNRDAMGDLDPAKPGSAADPAIPSMAPALQRFPRQRDVPAVYGAVGTRQTTIEIPFDMALAWAKGTRVKRMTLHEKVAPSALRVLQTIAATYSAAERQALGLDLFGGSLNVRRMRGGSAYSMHSWGIAIDFDPERNALHAHAPAARLSHADALAFWRAWEAEGWLSLGRARDFDWMHVQAARL